jgi:hypothetical protein
MVIHVDDAPQSTEKFTHRSDVGDIRDVINPVSAFGEETGGHLLEHRVLRTACPHRSREGARGLNT